MTEVVCNDDRGGWYQLPWLADGTNYMHVRWSRGAAGAIARSAEVESDPARHEYYALNSYSSPIRRADNVFALTNIGLDIDIHGNHEPWQLNALKDDLYAKLMVAINNGDSPLAPTAVVDSGHGFQLLWSLERSVPCGSKRVDSAPGQRLYDMVWHDLAAWMELQLRSLSYAVVDRSVVGDRARLLRMPGTVNRDQVTRVRLYTGRKHSLHDLASRLDKVRKGRIYRPSMRPSEPAPKSDLFLDQRLTDLEHYVTAHRGAVEGHRNNLAHLYATTLRGIYGGQGDGEQRRLLEAFNSMFDTPLPKQELAAVYKSAKTFFAKHGNTRYYSVRRIGELLDLTEREAAKWFGGGSRKEQERSARRVARHERDDEIRARHAAGESQKDIAAALSVSTATVSRVLRCGVKASVFKQARVAEVRQMVSQGLTEAEISEVLGVAQATVSRDLGIAMQNCKNAPVLVVAAPLGLAGEEEPGSQLDLWDRLSIELGDSCADVSVKANVGQKSWGRRGCYTDDLADLVGVSPPPPGGTSAGLGVIPSLQVVKT